eukprot:856446-Rhodomonas_salina.3
MSSADRGHAACRFRSRSVTPLRAPLTPLRPTPALPWWRRQAVICLCARCAVSGANVPCAPASAAS